MNDTILEVEKLVKNYGHFRAVDGISFVVPKGKIIGLLGPNGAGKTVLFRAILELIPFKGKITWAPDAKIGYVPQKLFVAKDFPLTVSEFLHFKEQDHKIIHEILNSVGFKDVASSHTHNDVRSQRKRGFSDISFEEGIITDDIHETRNPFRKRKDSSKSRSRKYF